MQPAKQNNLRIVRGSGWSDGLRHYKIFVNGAYAGKIARKSTLDIKLDEGRAVIEARIDWTRSPPLTIEAGPGQQYEIEVANNWGAWAAMWAITFGYRSYLVLRRLS